MCWSNRGHTHEDLDSLFALVAMYLIKNKFDSADELVRVLNSWIRSLPVGTHAKEGSFAEKLDEVSDWPPGFPYVDIFLRNSTPPPASHHVIPLVAKCMSSGLGELVHKSQRTGENGCLSSRGVVKESLAAKCGPKNIWHHWAHGPAFFFVHATTAFARIFGFTDTCIG